MYEMEACTDRVKWFVRGMHRATMIEPTNQHESYAVILYSGPNRVEDESEYNTYSGAEHAIMNHLRSFN